MCDCLVPEYIKEQQKINALIEKDLRVQKKLAEKDVKMLLLGTGESGKSTILKQMLLIHGAGYSQAERINFKAIIFGNIIQSMKALLENMDALGIPLGNEDLISQKNHIITLGQSSEILIELDKSTIDSIIQLWADSGVAACFQRSREFQLNDSAKYYISQMLRIGDPEYIPTEQDILRVRVRTLGISETIFRVKNLTYRMFDVPGQRNDRRKWVHCFENCTAVLFLAAISEFDQVMAEDESTNRTAEALNVFKAIYNSRYFAKTSMILFLNKIDLLKEKIERGVDPKDYFPDFEGNTRSYEGVSQFFLKKFMACKIDDDPTRQIYAHFTCGTDTSNVKVVMSAVNETVIRKELGNIGFI